ncbi:hypothetical protein AOA60_21415, partial [Pseudomonas sp. 2822-17]
RRSLVLLVCLIRKKKRQMLYLEMKLIQVMSLSFVMWDLKVVLVWQRCYPSLQSLLGKDLGKKLV